MYDCTLIDDTLTLHLPNIRSLFQPRDGFALVEADFRGADAQVAAADAGATRLLAALADGHDIHSENAQLLYGTRWDGRRFVTLREVASRSLHTNGMTFRDNAKRFVHGTNFHGGARTIASVTSLPEDHIKRCQDFWCEDAHPAIGRWHRRVEDELRSRKMPVIRNAFGFRRVYVGGAPYGRTTGSNLLGQALGWICQSTVAIAINKAIERIDCNLDLLGRPRCGRCLVCAGAPIALLLQIHDSVLMEVELRSLDAALVAALRAAMDVEIPYDPPLYIPTEVKFSTSHWGDMHEWKGVM